MDIEWEDSVEKLIIEIMDEFSAEKESGFFDERSGDELNRFGFVDIFDGLDENSRVLVAHLPEEIQLENRVLDSLSTLCPTYY